MKAHIGADVDYGLMHTVVTSPANEADVEMVDELLHGKEEVAYADPCYTGAQGRVMGARRCSPSAAPPRLFRAG